MMQAQPTSYRFADNVHASSNNNFGNYVIRKGMGELRRPTWNYTETVIRILPCWNFSTNAWEPFRRSTNYFDFGDWIRSYDIVRRLGENGVSFLLYDPVANPSYDVSSNPCCILYKAINRAIDAKHSEPDWPAMLRGGAGRGAILSRPSKTYLIRTAIFRIKSKDMVSADRSPLGLSTNDPPYFFDLPKSVGEKLCGMLEEHDEDFKGNPEDFDAMYKYGDIVSLAGGAYVHIFQEGADPRQALADSTPKQLTVAGTRSQGHSDRTIPGYDMFIDKSFMGFSPQFNTTELERIVKAKQRAWEQVLYFPTDQEQAFLIQDGFPASAILYAWKDKKEWIKDETRSRAVGRVSATVMPATAPGVASIGTSPRSGMMTGEPAVTDPVVPQPTPPVGMPKIGGWGDKAWDFGDTAGDEPPVPAGATMAATATAREAAVRSAMEMAKARNMGRTI